MDPVFLVCAAVSLFSALMVVTRRNPVYSALWLMQGFLAFAVIFFNLGATFAGAMHILVYTGAILVLFLFVIMLLNLKEAELGSEISPASKVGLAVSCAIVAASLAWSGYAQVKWSGQVTRSGDEQVKWDPRVEVVSFEKRDVGTAHLDGVYACKNHPETVRRQAGLKCAVCSAPMLSVEVDWGGVKHVGWELFRKHALPFEILSLLIIIAIFGGVVLAKRKP